MEELPYFLWISLVTAFVCTAVKEESAERLGRGAARLFLTIGGGILLFAVIVQVICYLILP